MPKALGFGDVGSLERERVDAVLGGYFARHLLGRAVIGVGIVVKRIVQVEEDDLDAAHSVLRACRACNPWTLPC